MKLLTPGPVQIPRAVIEAIARQPHFHRVDEFREFMKKLLEKFRKIYPYGEPVVMPGTGTFAVDVAVYNYINPGDRVIAISTGEFGERMVESIESRGAHVYKLECEPGSVIPPDVVEDYGRKIGSIEAVAVVHNETSTGTTYRYLEKLQNVAYKLGAVLIVDSVSAFPAEPIENRVDVIAVASQKAFLSPPGAAILYLSEKPRAKAVPPSMNLARFLKTLPLGDAPYTPPINILYGLDAALDYILKIGLENYQSIHRERAEYLYNNLPLKPVPREPWIRSYTVTAFYAEKAENIVKELKMHGYIIATGMGKLKNSVIRIGVMGDIDLEDLKKVVEVITNALAR